MTAALFLLICGCTDVVSRGLPRPRRIPHRLLTFLVSAVLGIVIAVASVLGLGTPPTATGAVAVCAVIWSCLPLRPMASAVALGVAVTAFLLVDVAPASAQAPMLPWFTGTPSPLSSAATIPALIAAIGLLALIGPASNDVVTDTLMWAGRRPHGRSGLRGGRLIGPLERVLIVALCLTGAYGALAALVAAKGVVRFPEISRDEDGVKAEEFLIGSLTSWTLAGAAALIIAVCG